MKKVKFLALVMVFAIMLMGVGYAAWTDKITINTTVATGELDVDFTAVTAAAIDEPDRGNLPSQISPLTPTIDTAAFIDNGDGTDRIRVEAGNLYPGASFQVIAQVSNRGTIPSILEGISISGSSAPFLDLLQVNVQYDDGNYIAPGNGAHRYIDVYNGAVSGLNNNSAELLELALIPLDLNDFDEVILTFQFPFATPDGAAEGYFENISNTFNIDLNWVQFNAPAPVPAPVGPPV